MTVEHIDYDDLVKILESRTLTQLPALLSIMIKICIQREVFVDKQSMHKFIHLTLDRYESRR